MFENILVFYLLKSCGGLKIDFMAVVAGMAISGVGVLICASMLMCMRNPSGRSVKTKSSEAHRNERLKSVALYLFKKYYINAPS